VPGAARRSSSRAMLRGPVGCAPVRRVDEPRDRSPHGAMRQTCACSRGRKTQASRGRAIRHFPWLASPSGPLRAGAFNAAGGDRRTRCADPGPYAPGRGQAACRCPNSRYLGPAMTRKRHPRGEPGDRRAARSSADSPSRTEDSPSSRLPVFPGRFSETPPPPLRAEAEKVKTDNDTREWSR
jgi:hypothetical protein